MSKNIFFAIFLLGPRGFCRGLPQQKTGVSAQKTRLTAYFLQCELVIPFFSEFEGMFLMSLSGRYPIPSPVAALLQLWVAVALLG